VSEAVAVELGRCSAKAILLGAMLLEAGHESENGYVEQQLRANICGQHGWATRLKRIRIWVY
jgi:hypothetical protein